MKRSIKILILEDSPNDATLLLHELKKSGLSFTSEIVQTRQAFENAIQNFQPDLILSDYSLPDFGGVAAFKIKQKISPGIPFIIVSGTIGEENAVELIKRGVTDYALKDKLFSLPQKIRRALKEVAEKQEKKIIGEKLVTENEKLLVSEAQVRNFAKHLNQVLEDERAFIAREMHDELGHQLLGLKMGLAVLKEGKQENSKEVADINEMVKNVNQSMKSVREIATQLRPGTLDMLGLIPSIEWLAKEFHEKARIKCTVEVITQQEEFEKNISIGLFRICQEALTNISKHAEATEVKIGITQNDTLLSLEICDNGKGFSTEKSGNPFSMGLLGMKERARLMDAQLFITSGKGRGTTIQVQVNLFPSQHEEKSNNRIFSIADQS